MISRLAALFLVLGASPTAAALVNLGSTPIGPDRLSAAKDLVSEDGAHFAQLVAKDGKEIWYLDGRKQAAERPGAFIYMKNAYGEADVRAVVGSDGRLAYARRVYDPQGQPIGYAVVIGGRQGSTYEGVSQLVASPSGAHFSYVAKDSAWRVVVDGALVASHRQPPGELAIDDGGRAVYLAPRDEDGARYMYLGGKPLRPWTPADLALAPGWRSIAGVDKREYGKERVLVDDDKTYGPYTRVDAVRFSADGKHVFYAAESPEGGKVFLDGRPVGPGAMASHFKEGAMLPPARMVWFGEGNALYADGNRTVVVETPMAVGAAPGGEHYAALAYLKKGLGWIADGVLEEGPSGSLVRQARVVFDSADEFHVLTDSGGLASLSCLGFRKMAAEASVCMRRARGRYKAYDEDDPEMREGVLRKIKAAKARD